MAKRKKQILESKPQEQEKAPPAPVEKVDFDAWYALREGRIARQHHKEIIKADFRARGLSQHESMDDFDEALRKYGVKLD